MAQVANNICPSIHRIINSTVHFPIFHLYIWKQRIFKWIWVPCICPKRINGFLNLQAWLARLLGAVNFSNCSWRWYEAFTHSDVTCSWLMLNWPHPLATIANHIINSSLSPSFIFFSSLVGQYEMQDPLESTSKNI